MEPSLYLSCKKINTCHWTQASRFVPINVFCLMASISLRYLNIAIWMWRSFLVYNSRPTLSWARRIGMRLNMKRKILLHCRKSNVLISYGKSIRRDIKFVMVKNFMLSPHKRHWTVLKLSCVTWLGEGLRSMPWRGWSYSFWIFISWICHIWFGGPHLYLIACGSSLVGVVVMVDKNHSLMCM